MKKFLSALFSLLFIFTLSYGAERQPKTIDEVLTDMEKADKNIKDMEMNFSQEIYYSATNEKQLINGEVKYKKNDNIYMYQQKPQEQHTYIDGKKIIIYVPANSQAVVDSWKNVLKSDVIPATIVGFSKNWKQLKKDNTITLTGITDTEYNILLEPNKKPAWKMYINVDKITMLPNSAVFDNGNFKVDVILSDYKINTGLQDNIFKFKAPAGVDVIEL